MIRIKNPDVRRLAWPVAIGLAVGGWWPGVAIGTGPPTFARDLAPILRARCQECHRADEVGPFPLESFDQARKRAGDLVAVVESRRMPPWKPEPGVGPKLGHDRSLSTAEIAVFRDWADAGAPRGDDRETPPPTRSAGGWALGLPDLVIEMLEDFKVPATGPDLYRCFVIPTSLPRDRYVAAVEYRPGNRRVVHHLMAFVETAGAGRRRDLADSGPGYASYSGAGVDVSGDLGGWAPGNEPTRLPDGVGRALPRGADVLLQVHYHPSGKPETDRTRIGLYLARGPVRQTLQWNNVTAREIRLPAGNADVVVRAHWVVPVDLDILAVAPHMHQLGRSIRMTATSAAGPDIDLIQISDWDPGWQGTYTFETPLRLTRGTIVKVVAHYDNSAHPRNPNHPPRLVRQGPESTDEMCVGYIAAIKVGQDLTRPGDLDDLFAIFVDQRLRTLERERAARRR